MSNWSNWGRTQLILWMVPASPPKLGPFYRCTVHAGMVEGPGEYPWSSYACNALGRPDTLVIPHPVYQELNRDPEHRRAAYRRLFRDGLSDELPNRFRDATNACLIIGNDMFKD